MEYEKVPDILTGKDLDYLQDMFNWSYCAYKNAIDASNMLEDKTLVKCTDKVAAAFYSSMEEVLEILEMGGSSENSK